MKIVVFFLAALFSWPTFAMEKPAAGFNADSMQGLYLNYCQRCSIDGNHVRCASCFSIDRRDQSGPTFIDLRFCRHRSLRTDIRSAILRCTPELYGSYKNHCKDDFVVGSRLYATCRKNGNSGSGWWVGYDYQHYFQGGLDLAACRDKRVDYAEPGGLTCEPG
jgi:hypothetical protein